MALETHKKCILFTIFILLLTRWVSAQTPLPDQPSDLTDVQNQPTASEQQLAALKDIREKLTSIMILADPQVLLKHLSSIQLDSVLKNPAMSKLREMLSNDKVLIIPEVLMLSQPGGISKMTDAEVQKLINNPKVMKLLMSPVVKNLLESPEVNKLLKGLQLQDVINSDTLQGLFPTQP